MADVPKDTEKKISQLQMLEQSMQQFLQQKQQFQLQLVEVESALTELEDTTDAYKMVGNIMVATDKKTLTEDLKKKQETTELRIKTMEKQETQMREKAQKIQEEVMKEMK